MDGLCADHWIVISLLSNLAGFEVSNMSNGGQLAARVIDEWLYETYLANDKTSKGMHLKAWAPLAVQWVGEYRDQRVVSSIFNADDGASPGHWGGGETCAMGYLPGRGCGSCALCECQRKGR